MDYLIDKFFSYLEKDKAPLVNYALSFFGIFLIRLLLEKFSYGYQFNFGLIAHFFLSFLAVLLSSVLILSLITRKPIPVVAKMCVAGSSLILLGPILDLIINFGNPIKLTYLTPGQHDDLIRRYFLFGGAHNGTGLTLGIRLEVFLIVLVAGFFVYLATKKITKGVVGSWMMYTLLFLYSIMPFYLRSMGPDNALTYVRIYFIIIILLGFILFLMHKKREGIALLKDLRYLRILHYLLMLCFGILIGSSKRSELLNSSFYINLILLGFAIIGAALFSIVINNKEDIKIDRISNPSRPSVKNEISSRDYLIYGYLGLIIAVSSSVLVSPVAFFAISFCVGAYYLYSAPPFRIKRVPLFSKLVITLNSLVLMMLGFSLSGKDIYLFPREVIVFMLTAFLIGANFIDLKDFRGDKRGGIATMPGILGMGAAQFVIGASFLAQYILIGIFLSNFFVFFGCLVLGTIEFWLIVRTKYREFPVLALYICSLFFLNLYLWFFPLCAY